MGFFRFLQALFRGAAQPVALMPSPAPAALPRLSGSHAASPSKLQPEQATPRLMVLREEMLDRTGRLAGYRFSCKAADDGEPVTPARYLDALQAANARTLAERRQAVITISLEDWGLADFASLVGPHTVFLLQCRAQDATQPPCRAAIQAMRSCGAGVALSIDDASALRLLAPCLPLATHAFVDFSAQPVEAFEKLVMAVQEAGPQLVLGVDNVATWPVRRMCVALGIEFAMGYFLSTIDEREQGEKITDSRVVLMDMLNLVRNDGDAEALAALAKRDPGVSVHLLSMANSPAYGLKVPLTGIDQAILVLGRETLYRWLAVSLFKSGSEKARDEALLEVALARACFLEQAGVAVGTRQNADELFLVGVLSFADSLLGMPMVDVLKGLSLPAVVRSVLLSSEGPYGRFLLLALAVERCEAQRATQLAISLGIQPDALTRYRDAALQWAEHAVHPC